MLLFLFFTVFAAVLGGLGFLIRFKEMLKNFADFDLSKPGSKSNIEKSVNMDALAEFLSKWLFIMAAMVFVMGFFFSVGWSFLGWIFALPVAVIPFMVIYQLNTTDRFLVKDKEEK